MGSRSGPGLPTALTLVALLAGALAAPAPAAAQGPGDRAALRASGFVAGSLREGPAGFGVARDVVSGTFRLTLPRIAFQPWVQVDGFHRPDFECLGDIPCNEDGWTVLAGVVLPFTADDTRPGLHPYALGGIGAAFSAEDQFSYFFGIGAAFPLNARIAPSVELRWQDLPGIRNVLMANVGLRFDLF